jgi:aminomethyltransferase
MASAYDPHPDREYAAIRNAAGLIDVSPLFKYRITGKDAARLLDRMVTRDVKKLAVGQVYYTPWCDVHGKVIDDGTISRLDAGTFRLTSAEPNLRWLAMNAVGLDVTIDDISDSTGALALQGPLSRTILQQVSPADFAALKYFRLVHTTVRDIPVTISRTGYTGDLGYEVWVEADRAVALWDALIEAGTPYGITPAGIWALDLARIEAGLVMLDVDYFSSHHAVIEDQKSSPLELTLQRAPRATRREGAWPCVGVRRDRGELGLARASVRRAWTPAAVADGRVARERAALSGRQADRIRDKRLLVAVAQEVSRARARAGAAFRGRYAGWLRDLCRASAQADQCRGAKASLLRS